MEFEVQLTAVMIPGCTKAWKVLSGDTGGGMVDISVQSIGLRGYYRKQRWVCRLCRVRGID